MRKKAAQHGPFYLHRVLARMDKQAAARIAPRDTQKIIRAIEIRKLAGKSVGEIHRRGRSALDGFDVVKIGLQPPARSALRPNQRARRSDDCGRLGGRSPRV